MATKQSSTPPPFFNFLKEGLLLPTRNRSLFAAVLALIVASSFLLLFGNDLAVQPLTDEIRIDASKMLNITDPSSPEFQHLIKEIQDDTRKLFIASAVYLVVALVIGSVIRVLVLFAAVATYSGELHHTFGSLLGKARAQLKGPLLTLAFVYVLEIACVTLLVAMAGLLTFLMNKAHLALLFAVSLLTIAASVFVVYFSFVCSLSVVVAVAEPGCHGASAVGRAWRLVKGKLRRAAVFVSVTSVLSAAVWPVYNLAKKSAVSNMASGLLLVFLYTILMDAVGVFATCAMTAFYYECRESTEASATAYTKVSTKESINV